VLVITWGVAVCNPDWLLTILDVGIPTKDRRGGRGWAWASVEGVRQYLRVRCERPVAGGRDGAFGGRRGLEPWANSGEAGALPVVDRASVGPRGGGSGVGAGTGGGAGTGKGAGAGE
jgi:hypothetical protein